MKLSHADRRELAEALLDSVPPGEDDIPPEWREEFERRIAHAKAHPEEGIPLEDFLREFEERAELRRAQSRKAGA